MQFASSCCRRTVLCRCRCTCTVPATGRWETCALHFLRSP